MEQRKFPGGDKLELGLIRQIICGKWEEVPGGIGLSIATYVNSGKAPRTDETAM